MKKSLSADIYLRFLQLAETIRGLPTLPALDPLEERLLEQIANAGTRQQRLCVRDLMAQRELADTEDARRKQIELSEAAHAHFEKLSACIVQAAEEH